MRALHGISALLAVIAAVVSVAMFSPSHDEGDATQQNLSDIHLSQNDSDATSDKSGGGHGGGSGTIF